MSGGNFSVYLTGTWALVFFALALGYYFVLEAWAGQTVGKRLLGLRVFSAAGARPSVRAVAGRTLLRIVDWLPAFYLAGFITMLATGTRGSASAISRPARPWRGQCRCATAAWRWYRWPLSCWPQPACWCTGRPQPGTP